MLSTATTIAIILIAAFTFFGLGSGFAIWYQTRYHNRRMKQTNNLARELSTYHRAQLSVASDGANYADISQPVASLRRSGPLPYGVISEGWSTITSQEHFRPQPIASIPEHPEIDEMVPAPKRKRSLRQTLYEHSLYLPKTRRQRKIEKTLPLDGAARSPLSAITEFTDSTDAESCPMVTELPESNKPRGKPECMITEEKWDRPQSLQWPLPLAKGRSKALSTTIVGSVAAQDSIFERKKNAGAALEDRPTMEQGPISMESAVSETPVEPLPPLSALENRHFSKKAEQKVRFSDCSLETISSSMLGTAMASPSERTTDCTSFNSAAPTADLSTHGLCASQLSRDSTAPSSITLGVPAGRQTNHGYVTSTQDTNSFGTSIGDHVAMQSMSMSGQSESFDQGNTNSHLFDGSLKTVDAGNWSSELPSRATSHISKLSPSLPAPVTRSPYCNSSTAGRYSTLERQLLVGNRASTPFEQTSSAAEILTGSPRQILPIRPVTVATGNPLQWDLKPAALSLNGSPVGQKKGHRRQNCVRISNLPAVDPNKTKSKLHHMMEEEEEEEEEKKEEEEVEKEVKKEESRTSAGNMNVPGVNLLESTTPTLRPHAALINVKASPSPFQNRPILEPTSRPDISSKCSSDVYSQIIPCPDSDVFTSSHPEPSPTSIIAEALHNSVSALSQWPLSTTPRNSIKLNSNPPLLVPIEEPFEQNNPMLPSPTLTSAASFPRKFTVQGPRSIPKLLSDQASRNSSPSPLPGILIQKHTGDDLRRSIMMMRRMTSEGKLRDQSSFIYQNIGEENLQFAGIPTESLRSSYLSVQSFGQEQTSNKMSTNVFIAVDRRRVSQMTRPGSAMEKRRGKISMSSSSSIHSTGAASIWEDESVCGEEYIVEEHKTATSSPIKVLVEQRDLEAYENFPATVLSSRNQRIRDRESKLTSPHGKGLGLRMGTSAWGSPGSLYDSDGFLKDH